MFKQLTTQATAIALAAMTTLVTLASLNALATEQHAATTIAQDASPAVQQVVVTARRINRI